MDIQFLGGAQEVGRSGILVKDKRALLLDYGVKVESQTEYPERAGKVDACILSHAHLDHSGFTPSLYRDGFPVTFATQPTMQLAELLIEDSIKIHKRKHEHEHFSKNQLHTMLNTYVPLGYEKRYDFHEYEVSLYDAGHICGSAVSLIERKKDNRKVVYTGDFKIEPQLLEGGAKIIESDVLVLESTYANKDHPNRDELVAKLANDIKETIDNNGTALLPAFAVGRSQELLAILHKFDLIGKTYVDGMARAATEIVASHPDYIKDKALLEGAIRKSVWIDSRRKKSEAIEGGNIIVTTSGMLNGGPVLDYITKLNRNSKIFLTGYQVEDTNGHRMMNNRPINIDGREYRVRTPFQVYDLSAHAGKKDLHDYVRGSNPEAVICVHGSEENTKMLAEDLRLEGFNAFAPKVGDVVKVDF